LAGSHVDATAAAICFPKRRASTIAWTGRSKLYTVYTPAEVAIVA